MAKTLSAFINNIKAMVGLGIYVWGANGELLSSKPNPEEWIREKETSTKNAEKAIKLYRKRKDKAVRAMDCSGLIVYSLRATGAKSKTFDTTANGLFIKQCIEIDKGELRDGDLCFKMSDGVAKHVGMYCGGKVIESRGRAYGVVSRSLALGGWKKYGRLTVNWDDEPDKFVLTRLLKKGCRGTDVTELQHRLTQLGYSSVGKVDGIFGAKTRTAVRELQKNSGIKVDGIVGRDTCRVLGWDYKN